jgi:cytochrome c553
MRYLALALACTCVGLARAAAPAAEAQPPPAWAYPGDAPGPVDAGVPPGPVRVPGSRRQFARAVLEDLYAVPDWYPEDHRPMPAVVARGRRPGVYACGYCHLPDGAGRPENASLAGLPVAYLVRQVADMKSGARRSALPERVPVRLMLGVAAAATEAEVRRAAEYFARERPRHRVRVVESARVPATHAAGWVLVADRDRPREAIGTRVIELADDAERFEHRDARVGYTAFVPPGSVRRGEALVRAGEDGVPACTRCHGLRLGGAGTVPGLAGRSPSYLVRQLYDFAAGARAGPRAAAMIAVARRLQPADRVAVAAYLATLD